MNSDCGSKRNPNNMSLSSRSEYIARINRAVDYIENNLDRELTLREIADRAWFSPFHFHRIFSGIMGETLAAFIRRIRLEKAALRLLATDDEPVTVVALDYGFSSSSVFSRAFRNYFGMSATEWRRRGGRKDCKTVRKNGQAAAGESEYDTGVECDVMQSFIPAKRRTPMKVFENVPVEIRSQETLHVAYVRHVGPYAGDSRLFEGLFARLMRWAGPRGLLARPDLQTLIVYHDNPDLTDASRLRTSVCITVPGDTAVSGEVGAMEIPAGQYACARFELDPDQYAAAWDYVCGTWLPDSGWQPDDRPCFELCLNNPATHPERKHIVDICIPVKPL